jgi:hypothetical protein
MYQSSASIGGAVGTSGLLAYTGANVLWAVLAGFAMLAAGSALMRIVPRRGRP